MEQLLVIISKKKCSNNVFCQLSFPSLHKSKQKKRKVPRGHINFLKKMQLIVFNNNNNNPLYKLSFVALCFLVKCHTRAAVARAMIPHTPACAYAFTNNKTKQIYTITYYYTIHNITLLYVPWKSVNCVSYIYLYWKKD